jgi:hypothetical protein
MWYGREKRALRDHIDAASSKILPRLQNSRTNVNMYFSHLARYSPMQKKVDKNSLFYFINVALLIPTNSPHYFCIRLGNQEYSRSQLPTKMQKLED